LVIENPCKSVLFLNKEVCFSLLEENILKEETNGKRCFEVRNPRKLCLQKSCQKNEDMNF